MAMGVATCLCIPVILIMEYVLRSSPVMLGVTSGNRMKYVIWVLIFIVIVVNHSTNESDKEVENSVEIVLENLLDKNSLYEYIQSGGVTRFRGAIAVSYCESLSYIKKTEIIAHNGAK
mgnify:CR=1 FL=1